jgi:hypothetical protein
MSTWRATGKSAISQTRVSALAGIRPLSGRDPDGYGAMNECV